MLHLLSDYGLMIPADTPPCKKTARAMWYATVYIDGIRPPPALILWHILRPDAIVRKDPPSFSAVFP